MICVLRVNNGKYGNWTETDPAIVLDANTSPATSIQVSQQRSHLYASVSSHTGSYSYASVV